MKTIRILSACVLLSGLLTSCSEQKLQDTEMVAGEQVSCDLQLSVEPLQEAFEPAMRAATRKNEGIDIICGSSPDTRATTDLSVEEKKIKSLYMLQFAGTAINSPLANKSGNLISNYSDSNGGGTITNVSFSNTGSINRIYLVANVDVSTFTGTLGDFLSKRYELPDVFPTVSTWTPGVPASGIPMAAYQDFIPSNGASGIFSLCPLLAKISMSIYTGGRNVNLDYNGPKSYTCDFELAPGDARVGADIKSVYNTQTVRVSVDLIEGGNDYLFYVPANLAGRNTGVVDPTQRSPLAAPDLSTYIRLSTPGPISYGICIGSTVTDFNVQAGHNYSYKILVSSNEERDPRCAITFERLDEDETANCYMPALGTGASVLYSFDCSVMGNGKSLADCGLTNQPTLPPITSMAGQVASVEVLWETGPDVTAVGDVVSRVTLVGNKVLFRRGTKPGNAVIAAKNASGTILWSWHIWCPVDISLTTPFYTITVYPSYEGYFMMGGNLGAMNITDSNRRLNDAGLFYQWGRKDPYPGVKYATKNAPALTNVVGVSTPKIERNSGYTSFNALVIRSIGAPNLFFEHNIADMSNKTVPALWGWGSADKKTAYDPCPPGWRVPNASVLTTMVGYGKTGVFHDEDDGTGLGKGLEIRGWDDAGKSLFFPAAGWVEFTSTTNGTGILKKVGETGIYLTERGDFFSQSGSYAIAFHRMEFYFEYGLLECKERSDLQGMYFHESGLLGSIRCIAPNI